ncbi:ABC transporter ATP-binding protein [Macrococcus capreoli]|uniref:ABC transporter ATP-binding protein n=1 Tax=Macrococcus capreoli TaxID=2982690 RepID=UPI003EE65086
MIEFRNVTMHFKDITAVDHLNLTINDGELVSILGPSGCGKSTTLMMLAGLLEPQQGQIFINGKDVTRVKQEDRNVGMVFQDYALYPHMTIFDNIAFPLKMKKLSKSSIKEKVMNAAKLVEIDTLLHRLPKALSGGQQQRVAIARAIVKEPEVLLMDEPLSNLDARLRLTMREEIRELQQRLNMTTLFVTHDQEEAMSISDKIVLLQEGALMQYGTPSEMYEHPNNKFVAEFIGNPPINFLNVNETTKLLNANVTLQSNQLIGVRPEDFVIQDKGYPVIIKVVEKIGKDVLLTTEDRYQQRIKLFVHKHHAHQIGETIYLTVDDKDIKIFDVVDA